MLKNAKDPGTAVIRVYVDILDARWGAEAPHLARVSDLRPPISALKIFEVKISDASDLRAKDLRGENFRAKDL